MEADKKHVLSIDLETYSDVDLGNCGVYRYVEGDFHILLFAYAFDDGDVRVVDMACGETLPKKVVDAIFDENVIKAAWNAQFERTCLSQYFGVRLSPDSWQCSMVWSASLSLPLKLKTAAEVLKTGEQKDDAGRTVLERVPKPTQDSVGVLSDVNIRLPYGYSAPEGSGFGFADSWTDSGKTEYAYYIPSKYLYEVNLTSLVVAPVSGQGGGYGTINVYQGQVFQTWEFGKVLIGITPYKKPLKSLTDSSKDVTHRRNRIRIVGIKVGADWSQEYQSLLQYLLHEGFLPDYSKLQGIQDIDTVAEYQTMTESYTEVDYMSLADRKRLEAGDFSGE